MKQLRRYSSSLSSRKLRQTAMSSPIIKRHSSSKSTKEDHLNIDKEPYSIMKSEMTNQHPKVWQAVLDDTKYQQMISYEIENYTQFKAGFPSLYQRELDKNLCIEFNSVEGRELFKTAICGSYANIYYTLAPQIVTQYNSLFCGPSSLVFLLNALRVDPKRQWKYPWRWYDDSMLNSCKPMEHTSLNGCSLDALVCMAKCNNLSVEAVRASKDWNIEDFRNDVKRSCASFDLPMIANFSRGVLNQSGTGHFSPIGAYNEKSDMLLILETARFKHPTFWVRLDLMWEAMQSIASNGKGVSSGHPRGYLVLQTPSEVTDQSVTIKMPWNIQMKFNQLSEENVWQFFIIKECFKQCVGWLDNKYDHTLSIESIVDSSIELALSIMGTSSLRQTPNVNKLQILSSKNVHVFTNEFTTQMRRTKIYEIVSEKLKHCNVKDLEQLEILVFQFANLIYKNDFAKEKFEKVKNDSTEQQQKQQQKLSEQFSYEHNADQIYVDSIKADNPEFLAICVSVVLIFWPYEVNKELSTFEDYLLKEVQSDLQLFPPSLVSSARQQIQFVGQYIRHTGHEQLYKKPNDE